LISFDKRGVGLSDPAPFDVGSTLEEWASDIATVMDAVESRRAAVFGHHDGGWPAMLLAASHRERVSHLCLVNTTARIPRSPDNPWGIPLDRFDTPEQRVATYGRATQLLDSLCQRTWRRGGFGGAGARRARRRSSR
jgi:pimeloyl-ACP methyl ester carboxylesterase